jgi:hypothetical protein
MRCRWIAIPFALLLATGCGKKDDKTAADKAKKDAEKKLEEKPPYEIGRLSPVLSETLIDADANQPLRLAKPGHWSATVQTMKANKGDFEGRTRVALVDSRGRPAPLPLTAYQLTTVRPLALAKGRAKRIESVALLPAAEKSVRLGAELIDRSGGLIERKAPSRWTLMPSEQYFLLVLSREPARYAYLKVADAIRAPYEDEIDSTPPQYRVVLADADKPLPLPSTALAWTSVAYVFWDGVNPDRLSTTQQEALVDWLHWGGRLVVSGPDSLDSLRTGFLAKYLPAVSGGSGSAATGDLQSLSSFWAERTRGSAPPPLSPARPLSIAKLEPRPGARSLPGCEGLIYEANVGAGSICVSALRLTERQLVNWPGFDGLLNGALLRRPRRSFGVATDGEWSGLQTVWADAAERRRDAHFTTPVRWLARDAGVRTDYKFEAQQQNATPSYFPGQSVVETAAVAEQPGGMGQWNDFGPYAQAARESLLAAAGIHVPGAGFVLACLGIYLVVLAPLNWMVFHALGRVELAWLAAPVIALVGTLVVVRQAQLDIGFVRSRTEVALLELYGDHPRGHLARYTALYTSLSTTSDVLFDDPTSLAAPFPTDADPSNDLLIGDEATPVTLELTGSPRLRGLAVSSASTQLIHSEQMMSLAGPILLTSPSTNPRLLQIENRTGLELVDAAVLRRRRDARGQMVLEACWLGRLGASQPTLLHWTPLTIEENKLPFADERAKAAELRGGDPLDVERIFRLAYQFPADDDPLQGGREETRLVARVEGVLPGATTDPAVSQTSAAAVVVARLSLGPPPTPRPDVNRPVDVLPLGKQPAVEENP